MATKVQVKVKSSTGDSAPAARFIDLRPQTQSAPPQQEARFVPGRQNYEGNGELRPEPRYNRDFDEDSQMGRDVPTQEVSGILDVAHDGHGFLRPKFRPSDADVYISSSQIRKFMLRPGDDVEGMGRPPKENERYYGLLKVVKVNGE